MPGPFFLVFFPAVVLAALAPLGRVLVRAQPMFQLLGAALFPGRGVPLALLLAQRLEFLLESVVTAPGRIIGVGHGRVLLVAVS
jgi:hypothetical protein